MIDKEATDKQYALMEKLGIEYDPAGVSVGEARALIEAKLGKKPKDITSNYSQDGNKMTYAEKQPLGLDKDTLIVRQSCLKAAVELGNAQIAKLDINVDNVETVKTIIEQIKKAAEEFEKWVFR